MQNRVEKLNTKNNSKCVLTSNSTTTDVTYKKVTIRLIYDDLELRREGYYIGDIIEAEQEVINGKPRNAYYFGNCVAYEGDTCEVLNKTALNNIKKLQFLKENKDLKIEDCKHDKGFLLIKNSSFQELSRLCSKYGASGMMVGKNGNDALIGNFEKYNNNK